MVHLMSCFVCWHVCMILNSGCETLTEKSEVAMHLICYCHQTSYRTGFFLNLSVSGSSFFEHFQSHFVTFDFSENQVTVSTSMQIQISHPGRVSGKLGNFNFAKGFQKDTNLETQSGGPKVRFWFLKPLISVSKAFEVVPTS